MSSFAGCFSGSRHVTDDDLDGRQPRRRRKGSALDQLKDIRELEEELLEVKLRLAEVLHHGDDRAASVAAVPGASPSSPFAGGGGAGSYSERSRTISGVADPHHRGHRRLLSMSPRSSKRLPSATFDDAVAASASAQALMSADSVGEERTSCMRCDAATSGYRLCACCGICCCDPCCSNVVFELNKRRPVFICDHCFEFSSKIHNRDENDMFLVRMRKEKIRRARGREGGRRSGSREGSGAGGQKALGSVSAALLKQRSDVDSGGGRGEGGGGGEGDSSVAMERQAVHDVMGGGIYGGESEEWGAVTEVDRRRVASFVESRLGDDTSAEGSALRVLIKAFTSEGQQWLHHQHAHSLSDALLKNVRDFVDRVTEHICDSLLLNEEPGDEDAERLARVVYITVLRVVIAPVAARIVAHTTEDNAGADAELHRRASRFAGDPTLPILCDLDPVLLGTSEHGVGEYVDTAAGLLRFANGFLDAPVVALRLLGQSIEVLTSGLRARAATLKAAGGGLEGTMVGGADVLYPLFYSTVIRAGLPRAASLVAVLRGLLEPRYVRGKDMWAIASLEAALYFTLHILGVPEQQHPEHDPSGLPPSSPGSSRGGGSDGGGRSTCMAAAGAGVRLREGQERDDGGGATDATAATGLAPAQPVEERERENENAGLGDQSERKDKEAEEEEEEEEEEEDQDSVVARHGTGKCESVGGGTAGEQILKRHSGSRPHPKHHQHMPEREQPGRGGELWEGEEGGESGGGRLPVSVGAAQRIAQRIAQPVSLGGERAARSFSTMEA